MRSDTEDARVGGPQVRCDSRRLQVNIGGTQHRSMGGLRDPGYDTCGARALCVPWDSAPVPAGTWRLDAGGRSLPVGPGVGLPEA